MNFLDRVGALDQGLGSVGVDFGMIYVLRYN